MLVSYWHSLSSQAWKDWFYFLCLIAGFQAGCCADNMRMLPGLCQHFQCSCSINGWAVNCLHSNGQTWPGWWRTPVSLSKRNSKRLNTPQNTHTHKVLLPLPTFWFLRSRQRFEGQCQILLFSSISEGFGGASLAPCCTLESRSLLSLNITGSTSFSKADPPQGNGRA